MASRFVGLSTFSLTGACMPVIVLVLIFVLIGCEERTEPHAMFDNYTYRLANSLDQKQSALPAATALLRYPERSVLQHSIPPLDINLIEFLRLSDCKVQRLVGQNNSSLGKLGASSQALIYDTAFIEQAQACVEYLLADDESSELALTLANAVEHKQNYWSAQFVNATLASHEWAHLYSNTTYPLTPTELAQPPDQLFKALRTLIEVKQTRQINAKAFELALGQIGRGKYVGRLRQSMRLNLRYLQVANTLIAYRINSQPLCMNARANAKAEVMHQVFLKFYIGEIQPYLAKVYQQSSTLVELLDTLQKELPVTAAFDEFWQAFYASPDGEWPRYQAAINHHTHQWQQLLESCGLRPGV